MTKHDFLFYNVSILIDEGRFKMWERESKKRRRNPGDLMSVSKVAEDTGFSEGTVRYWIAQKQLRATFDGYRYWVSPKELKRFLDYFYPSKDE